MDNKVERYPPKKGKKGDGDKESREDKDNVLDGEDGGVEYEDVAHLQLSDGGKQSRRLQPPATASC